MVELGRGPFAPFNQHTGRLVSLGLTGRHNEILDAGAGRCTAALWLADQGHRVVAGDLEYPEGHGFEVEMPAGSVGSLRLVHFDLMSSISLGVFDLVLLLGVLHYASGPAQLKAMLRSAALHVAPDGRLACSWLLSTDPPKFLGQFHPPIDAVASEVELIGFTRVDLWQASAFHNHGTPHRHDIAYAAWRRRP